MTAPIGTRLRDARIERGLTQAEVADIVAVTANYIARVERGEREPSPIFAALIELWLEGRL